MPAPRLPRVAFTAIALAASCALAGPLNPPAGPVAPTLRTLDQIEPRRAINDLPGAADAVHVITEPGSYYLTEDLIGEPGKHCVLINVPSSTAYPHIEWNVDLNGFTIIGGAGSLDGVHCVATPGEPVQGVNIHIGQEVGGGVTDTGGDAIHLENVLDVNIAGLTITDCGGDAVDINNSALMGTPLSSGRKALCQWITASNIGGDGVRVIATSATDIHNCTFTDTGGDGLVIGDGNTASVTRCTVGNAGANAYRIYIQRKFASQSCAAVSPGASGLDADAIDAVTLNGLIVTDASADACRVTNVSSFGVTEEGVKITAPIGNGLVVEDCDVATVANVHVVKAGGDAFRVYRVRQFAISKTPRIAAPTGDGFYFEDCDVVTLANVHVVDAGGFGIAACCCNGTVIKEVTIELCGTPGTGGGISADQVASLTVVDSVLNGNANDGLLVTNSAGGTTDLVFKKNRVARQPQRGLSIDAGSGTIDDCDFISNGGFGIETGFGFSGAITNNRLIDNAGPILVNGFGCNVTANAATAGPLGFIAVPTPGNVVGPIVDETNVGASCSPFANIMH